MIFKYIYKLQPHTITACAAIQEAILRQVAALIAA